MNGWIKLHKSLLACPIFYNERLLKVWLYCLLKTSHKDYDAIVGNQTIPLKAGQFIFGRAKAAIELNMNESAVYRNMKLLEKNGSISIKSNNKFSVITIENWDKYQVSQADTNSKRTADEQQMNTYKNNKNNKEVRHQYGEYKNVLLTDKQVEKLKVEVPCYEQYIEKISSWQESTGRSYKNYYSAIKDWYKRDKERGTEPKPKAEQEKYSF